MVLLFFLNEKLGEKLGIIEEEGQKLQKKLGVKLGIKLGINRQSMILLIHFYPRITRKELSHLLEVSITAIEANLSQLKKENIINRIGARKNGYWQINI